MCDASLFLLSPAHSRKYLDPDSVVTSPCKSPFFPLFANGLVVTRSPSSKFLLLEILPVTDLSRLSFQPEMTGVFLGGRAAGVFFETTTGLDLDEENAPRAIVPAAGLGTAGLGKENENPFFGACALGIGADEGVGALGVGVGGGTRGLIAALELLRHGYRWSLAKMYEEYIADRTS